RTVLAANLSDLPPLGATGHYEIFVGGTSVGTFRINDQGVATDLAGAPLTVTSSGTIFTRGIDLRGSNQVLLTIEPEGDTDPAPSGARLLFGTISADNAFLSLENDVRGRLGHQPLVSLNEAGAWFVLTSPSDDVDNDDNDAQGVHFVSQGLLEGLTALGLPAPAAPVMELGELPNNLVYEAWIIEDVAGRLAATGGRDRTQARFLSIGRFRDRFGNQFDSDVLGPQAGSDPLPLEGLRGWVGSDFVTQGPIGRGEDLSNGDFYVAISVEPVFDNDFSRPFTIILLGRIPEGGQAGSTIARSLGSTFDLDNTLFRPPTARIQLLP
ncbi:MAG TPA: hypothetical protein VEI97_18555, partial [bacterium]|nr:hypothetical protein [bacterium]